MRYNLNYSVGVAVTALLLLGQSSAIADGVPVKLAQPKHGEIWRNVTLPAAVAANQQVTLYAKITGYLKKITVDKGDEVKEGAVIAEIEAPELSADFARAKAEASIAQLDFKRVSEAQKNAPDLIVAQNVDAAKAKVEVAKANMERAETLLGFTKVTAPFSGVITRRFIDLGAFVPAATAGSASQNAAIVTLVDLKTVRVQVAVPESEVGLVKKGLPVKISTEGLPGKMFQGTITRFTPALDDATRTMLIEVDLPNEAMEFHPGMYATAKVGVEKHTEALLLPVEAVMVEKSGASVFTVVDGKAKKSPVKTGFNDGAFVEVVEGYAGSEPVIAVGKLALTDKQPVTVVEAK
jgi:membrane fusion protein (multidrug efflux system)